MNFKVKNFDVNQYLPKFQEGGEIPAESTSPETTPTEAPAEGGDPTEQILMACQQALQTQDCNLAMQICQAVIQMIGGGVEGAPAAPEGEQPVYRAGGKLSKWIKK